MLSIIVTIYNQQTTILRTLESIISNIKRDYEIIIIDDGSTDDSFKLISSLIRNHNNIFYYKITNSGVSEARNHGIKQSSCDYILFLDGDDIITSDIVELIDKDNSIKPDTDLILFAYERLERGEILLNKPIKAQEFQFAGVDLFIRSQTEKRIGLNMWTSSVIYKRDFIVDNKIYYSSKIQIGEDTEFQLKSLLMAQNVHVIQRVISRYIIRKGSLMTKFNIKRVDAYYAIGNLIDYIEENKNQFSSVQEKKLTKIQNEFKVRRINGFMYNYSYNYFSKKMAFKKLDSLIEEKYSNIFKEIRNSIFSLMLKKISYKSKLKLLFFLTFFINKYLIVNYYKINFSL